MEHTEQELYAFFGTSPKEEPNEESEVITAPVEGEAVEPPVESNNLEDAESNEEHSIENLSTEDENSTLPNNQNAKNAQRRRNNKERVEQKIQEATNEAKREEQKRFSTLLASLGLENSADGMPITTVEQLETYQAEKMERDMALGNITPELIAHHVTKAMEGLQQPTISPVQAQLQQIQEMDETIGSVADLATHPQYGEAFRGAVASGMDYLTAYHTAKSAHTQNPKAQEERAQLQAVQSYKSKGHLRPAQAQGTLGVVVPEDIKKMYRSVNGKMSDTEIQKQYSQYLKG